MDQLTYFLSNLFLFCAAVPCGRLFHPHNRLWGKSKHAKEWWVAASLRLGLWLPRIVALAFP